MSNPVLTARGKLGYQIRANNPEGITEARRNLAAEKILAYAEKIVAEAPPLTDEQCAIISNALTTRIGGDSRS